MTSRETEIITFTVTCTMPRRWASQFLGLLAAMQRLGSVGSSRDVTFFADGDGDFRPRFAQQGADDVTAAEPVQLAGERSYFDAG